MWSHYTCTMSLWCSVGWCSWCAGVCLSTRGRAARAVPAPALSRHKPSGRTYISLSPPRRPGHVPGIFPIPVLLSCADNISKSSLRATHQVDDLRVWRAVWRPCSGFTEARLSMSSGSRVNTDQGHLGNRRTRNRTLLIWVAFVYDPSSIVWRNLQYVILYTYHQRFNTLVRHI